MRGEMFRRTVTAGDAQVEITTNTDDPATLAQIGEQLAPHVQEPDPPAQPGGSKLGGSGAVPLGGGQS